jgi:hypothetical protein
MVSHKIGAEPGTLGDGLPEVIRALRAIHAGADANGRWYCADDDEAVGHNRSTPKHGYYDRCRPPAGYDANGWIGTSDRSEEPADLLKPCEWQAYTFEEQSSWLRTCSRIAKGALERLGVSVVDEDD